MLTTDNACLLNAFCANIWWGCVPAPPVNNDRIMSLVPAQREEGTDEEEEDDTPGDYIGDRLAHARLEATGQLYREVRSFDVLSQSSCTEYLCSVLVSTCYVRNFRHAMSGLVPSSGSRCHTDSLLRPL